MHKSSVYLPDELKASLGDAARRSGRSEADFIRHAIEVAIDSATSGAAAPAAPAPRTGPLLVGVGVGPGPADLVTVRALDALRSADVVLAASIGADAIGRAETILRVAAGAIRVERVAIEIAEDADERIRSIDAAAERLVEHLDRGQVVAFATLGDPNAWSVFPHLAAAVKARRPLVPIESVPGVMAFQELAARTGTVIADDGQTVRIVAVGADPTSIEAAVDQSLSTADETLVLYRGGRGVPLLAQRLSDAGRPGVVGELLGLPGERSSPVSDHLDRPAAYLACLIAPAVPA